MHNLCLVFYFRCVNVVNTPVPYLPLIIPILVARLASQEANEPSEEIRLSLVEFLDSLIDSSGHDIAPYCHDIISILRVTIVDPYPEVKKVG